MRHHQHTARPDKTVSWCRVASGGVDSFALIGNESVPKIIINDILVISNNSSFRVLFDKNVKMLPYIFF